MWSHETFDIEDYLAAIGFVGDRTPNSDTLHRLHRAHVLGLRWENLDALLRQHVPLDLPTLAAKLLHTPRGGYCFEHATLFAAALETLGFDFTAVTGRVQMGATAIRPATHALLIARLNDRKWLCDVGFGVSPLQPIPLEPDTTIDDGWICRLTRDEVTPGAPGWTLAEQTRDGWLIRHTFTEEPKYPIDFAVGNHFVATHPNSPFRARLFVQRVTPETRWTLDHRTLHTESPGGPRISRELTPDEVIGALADTFRIQPTRDDERLVRAGLAR